MEDDEIDCVNSNTVFPLCKKLEHLYKVLLSASSYRDVHEYSIFDYEDKVKTREKARIMFSEFDITGYVCGVDQWKYFDPPLNSYKDMKQNLEKIKRFIYSNEAEKEFQENAKTECHCTTPILHQFEVTSRVTNKKVFPIGNVCIMKFADTNTFEIMKRVSNVLMKSKSDIIKQKKAMEKKIMSLEEKQRKTELKLMRLEDKKIRTCKKSRKRKKCSTDCVCKRIAVLNKKQLDPLLFDIQTVNSKKYMDDYMNALGLSHNNISVF